MGLRPLPGALVPNVALPRLRAVETRRLARGQFARSRDETGSGKTSSDEPGNLKKLRVIPPKGPGRSGTRKVEVLLRVDSCVASARPSSILRVLMTQ